MEQSTGKIYTEFYEQLRDFIYSRMSDKSQVDDVLHDVFLKVHMNLESIRDHRKIRGWIFQIARNTINDYYRNRVYTIELKNNYLTDKEISDSTNAMDILGKGIKAIISLLPPKYEEALILTEYTGLTQNELAQKLGISLPGAKSRVQRGRKLLKEKLLEFCHFEFDRFGNVIDYHVKKCPVCFPKENR